jgi:hypothetical protein
MSPLVYSCCLFIGESIGYYTLVPKEIHIPEREEQTVNILFYQGSVLKEANWTSVLSFLLIGHQLGNPKDDSSFFFLQMVTRLAHYLLCSAFVLPLIFYCSSQTIHDTIQ